MKVKEFLERAKFLDPEAEILLLYENEYYCMSNIDSDFAVNIGGYMQREQLLSRFVSTEDMENYYFDDWSLRDEGDLLDLKPVVVLF